MWNNIDPGYHGNFAKQESYNMRLPYDYSSVMHYPGYAFATDSSLPTIETVPNPNVPIGQRYGISNLDLGKINALFNCGVCSTLATDTSGTFSSENYPASYHSNSYCVWLIRPPNNQALLQFDNFNLQTSVNCENDYIKVYDGNSRSSNVLLDRFCGTAMPPSLISSGNYMLVEFVTDETVSAPGFKARYSEVSCGQTFMTSSGVFSSPNYPSTYPDNMDCTWVIITSPGKRIQLQMNAFRLQGGFNNGCPNDYVTIHDGTHHTSPILGKYCGDVAVPQVVSSRNEMMLQFHSDFTRGQTGFQAQYRIVK
ncbi:embryonic protein UVS.2-like [Protopterus annectens]|uniref:embryonic protein UVS.2-like n=1 Tax=Protopterus annectens TaxID=7888 RepID=UPI001CFB3C95|nr:embryonic protein UVS.2-like [Protopterus annectens]